MVVDGDADVVGKALDDGEVVAVDLERRDWLLVATFGEWFGADSVEQRTRRRRQGRTWREVPHACIELCA